MVVPGGRRFLMSEVPLYRQDPRARFRRRNHLPPILYASLRRGGERETGGDRRRQAGDRRRQAGDRRGQWTARCRHRGSDPALLPCFATGVPRSLKTPPSWDPTVGLYLGPYGGPRGGCSFSRARYPCKSRQPACLVPGHQGGMKAPERLVDRLTPSEVLTPILN